MQKCKLYRNLPKCMFVIFLHFYHDFPFFVFEELDFSPIESTTEPRHCTVEMHPCTTECIWICYMTLSALSTYVMNINMCQVSLKSIHWYRDIMSCKIGVDGHWPASRPTRCSPPIVSEGIQTDHACEYIVHVNPLSYRTDAVWFSLNIVLLFDSDCRRVLAMNLKLNYLLENMGGSSIVPLLWFAIRGH